MLNLASYAEQTPTRQGDEHAHLDAFRDAMREAVQSRLVADVPLGAFLSGGVDSSLIDAWETLVAPTDSEEKLPTSREREFDLASADRTNRRR